MNKNKKAKISFINLFVVISITFGGFSFAKGAAPFDDKFKQLDQELSTPNIYRNAAGAPGHTYWQQKVDYHIKVRLDDNKLLA